VRKPRMVLSISACFAAAGGSDADLQHQKWIRFWVGSMPNVAALPQ